MPANHRQAEDRAYRLGQTERVTVEYTLADGTLDGFIAEQLEAKLRLIGAVEGDVPPDTSILDDLYAKLRSLGPGLLLENKLAQATGEVRERLEALAKANTGLGSGAANHCSTPACASSAPAVTRHRSTWSHSAVHHFDAGEPGAPSREERLAAFKAGFGIAPSDLIREVSITFS